ncbi:MAG: HK97-gp10 family putative phage morphogenesis protein [Methanofastidiosum sp.]|jgi:HK97 gp10 family phage protein
MAKMEIKIEGADKIIAELAKKDNKFIKLLEEGLTESANLVRDRAKGNAPFRTGKLKEAIVSGKPEITENKIGISVGISTSVKPFSKDGYYARFQEVGTSKMRAHPYLRPALDGSKNDINSIMSKKLKEEL